MSASFYPAESFFTSGSGTLCRQRTDTHRLSDVLPFPKTRAVPPSGVYIPGVCYFHFGSCHGGCPLCAFDRSVHLLPSFCISYWYQLLPYSTDQDIIFVFSLFLGAIGKDSAAVAVPLVICPLAFVLHTVGALADAEAGALVVLPLTHVDLRGGGVHVVFHGAEVTVDVAKADGGVGVAGADPAHGCVAADRAALAGDGRLGLGLAQFHASQEGAPAEEAALLLARELGVGVKVEHEAAAGAGRTVGGGRGVVEHAAVALLAAQRGQRRAQRRADHRGHAVGHALAHAVAVPHAAGPLALVGTFERAQESTA